MNTGISVRDRIKYMERMLNWFEGIYLCEDGDTPIIWRVGEGYYALNTLSIINALNGRITQYKMGVSNAQLERDKDMLNRYRELYNKNKSLSTTMGSLITTI